MTIFCLVTGGGNLVLASSLYMCVYVHGLKTDSFDFLAIIVKFNSNFKSSL